MSGGQSRPGEMGPGWAHFSIEIHITQAFFHGAGDSGPKPGMAVARLCCSFFKTAPITERSTVNIGRKTENYSSGRSG